MGNENSSQETVFSCRDIDDKGNYISEKYEVKCKFPETTVVITDQEAEFASREFMMKKIKEFKEEEARTGASDLVSNFRKTYEEFCQKVGESPRLTDADWTG